MSNPEIPSGPDRGVEVGVKELAEGAADRLKAEYERSANNWLSCFMTQLQVVINKLEIMEMKGTLSADKFEAIHEQWLVLVERARALRPSYPTRADIPPQDIQDELFGALNDLVVDLTPYPTE